MFSGRFDRQRVLFVAIVIAIPWVILGLLELGLRAAGFGSGYPLFVAAEQHADFLLPNPDIGKRYFGASPFAPTPEVELFRAARTSATYRIVFQGESSAQGFPYGHGGMPSRMLEQRLQATFPGRDIEVINTALTGVTSYTLLDQTTEIIEQRPDAVLIYTGHNEYYGVFGVGSSRGFGQRRALVRTYLAMSRSRIVQLLERLIAASTSQARGTAPRTVMQLMAGEQRIPLGSHRYQEGLEQFRENIGELLSRYRAHGIPVLIGTLASNERDQPPLASVEGGALDSADVYYATGQRLESAGDTVRARVAYREAKERDPLRFRAPEAINAIIREQAARHGASVVETQRAIERASPGGTPGQTLILEHLHPNLDGYFLIADAFYEAMRHQGLIGEWITTVPAENSRNEIAVTPIDSLVGVMRTDRLVSGWPFRSRGKERTPIVDTLRPRSEAERLAQAVVLGKLPWPEATERLRERAVAAGDYDLAARAALALAQEYSYSPEPLLDLAELSMQRGRDDDAIRYASAGTARQETLRGSKILGGLLLKRGEYSAAMRYLSRAAQLAPNDRRTVARFRAAGALPDLEAKRAASPRDPNALYNLAVAYALTDQNGKARQSLMVLRDVDPQHIGVQELLKRLPP